MTRCDAPRFRWLMVVGAKLEHRQMPRARRQQSRLPSNRVHHCCCEKRRAGAAATRDLLADSSASSCESLLSHSLSCFFLCVCFLLTCSAHVCEWVDAAAGVRNARAEICAEEGAICERHRVEWERVRGVRRVHRAGSPR